MAQKINENNIRRLISDNIKRLRSHQSISQMALALNSGLTQNFINDIENCKKGLSIKTLAKLSNALHVEPYQFFLPEDMSNNEMQVYLKDFNNSLQTVVNELTNRYAARDKRGKK